MVTIASIAGTASLVGDPARAAMLYALMDGRAFTASELAAVAGITRQTASGHLSQLVGNGLLSVEKQGRHRYHRLASPEVARMLEGIMLLTAQSQADAPARIRTGPRDAAMRTARSCYDHLAGRLAVALADSLVASDHIELNDDGGVVTSSGRAFFHRFGIDVDGLPRRRGGKARAFCRPCLDWSERRPHIAGAVGTALLDRLLERNWVRRLPGSRALAITPAGQQGLRDWFQVSLR